MNALHGKIAIITGGGSGIGLAAAKLFASEGAHVVMIFKPLQEQTFNDWQSVLGVDLLGAFYFTKQAFLRMTNGGSIVNVSSIHAVETTPLVSAYAAAKAALLSFTRSASLEGAAHNTSGRFSSAR